MRGLSVGFLGGAGAVPPATGLHFDWDAVNAPNAGGLVTGNMVDTVAGVPLAPSNAPAWNANALGTHPSIGFTAASSQKMSVASGVTLAQPLQIWSVHRLRAWGSAPTLLGGACTLCCSGSTPQLGLYAGGGGRVGTDGDLALNTWGICRAVFDEAGATSSVTIGAGTPDITGDPGPVGLTGAFAWGTWTGGANYADVDIIRTLVYDSTGPASAILAYLRTTYGL